jgi:hypothetical protein
MKVPTTKPRKSPISLRINADLLGKVRVLAAERKWTLVQILEAALETFFDDLKMEDKNNERTNKTTN